MSSNSDAHSELVARIRLALGKDPRIAIWTNKTGALKADFGTGGLHPMRFGLCVGSSDIIAVVRMPNGIGRFLALEAKTGQGRLQKDQRLFRDLVNDRGGYAVKVTSVEEAVHAAEAAMAGESAP